MELIRLDGISFAYPGRATVLDHADLTLREGERIGLMGPNGAGKTTLFHLIMGLLKPDSGRIEIFGREVREEKDFESVRRQIGFLFQDADDQLFHPTVLEDVAFGPLNLGKSREEAQLIALKTLEKLGLEHFEGRITHRLSGGEKRLVALATVLAMEPKVLLLDEPTAGLDERTKERLTQLLKGLDLTYIIISHELDFLMETTTAVYAMADGRIQWDEEVKLHRHIHGHRHGAYPHAHE
ncbi:energy-coupling factor ABC transporter ATP-binding protein [Desulfatiglans anilini]|uniref:energy-coupling factor ABC transporter ATP-binding protein n=1 Tax=Desulfatiglans anilini TaxID=90728 RepID=UPI000555CC8D|nr:ABC transporter ATP-binding protein [Desulfatiglans anilini]